MKSRSVLVRSKKRIVKTILFSALCSFIIFSIVSVWYFFKQRGKEAYISPVAKEVVDKNISDANTLQELLKEKNISFASISSFDNGSYLVHLVTGEEVIFSSQKTFNTQVSSLQLIVARLTIEGKHFMRLDFRFDKPAITLR